MGRQALAATPWCACRRYSGTHRYTAAILAYVFGVGSFMAVASPNFGGLFKKQQALEGAHRQLQVGAPPHAGSAPAGAAVVGRKLVVSVGMTGWDGFPALAPSWTPVQCPVHQAP